MMKQLAFLFYALALASAQADTNFIAVLTTADGISYTNAHIDHTTPIDADVWYDGGIVHIALTNLPPTLQKIYPYDTNTAAQFLAAEKQKLKEKQIAAQAQAAARQAWLEQSAKNAGWIYVVDCKKDCNPYIYTAYINKNYQQICLNNAPNKIINPPHVGRALLESMQALNTLQEGNFYHDSDERAVARQENEQSEEDELKAEDDERVRAFYTGQIISGIPVWQCISTQKTN